MTMTSLGDNELARRGHDGGLTLREEPLRVRWTFDKLISSDAHELRCAVECSVRALAEPTEQRMLQEVLLDGRKVLTAEHVAEHFSRAVRGAIESALGTQTVG